MERTELEVLEYLADKKVKTAQHRLNSFLKNNKLTNKDQVKATIEDYNMFHENVRLGVDEKGNILLGQKRMYISDGERDEPINRITGNSTNKRKPTGNVELLKEYFFSQLVHKVAPKEEGYSETMNQWGKLWVDMLPVTSDEREEYSNLIKDEFKDSDIKDKKHIEKISSNVLSNLRTNRRSLASKFIEELEKEKRIETEIEYFQAFGEDSFVVGMQKSSGIEKPVIHQIMSIEKNTEIVAGIENILAPYGVPYSRFKVVSAFNHLATSIYEVEAVEAVHNWLMEEYSIDYLYNRIRIWVTDSSSVQEVSHEEAKAAYVNRIIELTNNRMNRKDYMTTHKYQNAFYRLSMFLLLDMLKVKGLTEQIDIEKQNMIPIVESCKEQHRIKFGVPADEVIWGFGDRVLVSEINEVENENKKETTKRVVSNVTNKRDAQFKDENGLYDLELIAASGSWEAPAEPKQNSYWIPQSGGGVVVRFDDYFLQKREPVVQIGKIEEEKDYFDYDYTYDYSSKRESIDITTHLENSPKLRGFGWEFEQKKKAYQ